MVCSRKYLVLRLQQPLDLEGSLRLGEPEGEGEEDHLPTHLLRLIQALDFLNKEAQTLCVATSEDLSRRDQRPQ